MSLTIADLKSFVRSQSRRDFNDYGSNYYWRIDSNKIQSQRRYVHRKFKTVWNNNEYELVPGRYGRLTVTNNDIDYCPGQYAPTEIWGAVYSYLEEITNA